MRNLKRILIVNDDPYYVNEIMDILPKEKYAVEASFNYDEGLEALERGEFDLIILDMMMEHCMGGILFARKVRQDNRYCGLPLLMTAGHEEQFNFFYPGKNINPKFFHASAIVEKPISVERLLNKVNSLLERETWN
ncbi:MAG: two-component system response regulator [bacterium]